jgi:hypothetical protein
MTTITVNESERKQIIENLVNLCISSDNYELIYGEINSVISRFISASNSYWDIKDFSEKILGKYWEEACEEMADYGNSSWGTTFKIAMEKFLEQ